MKIIYPRCKELMILRGNQIKPGRKIICPYCGKNMGLKQDTTKTKGG